MRSRSTIELGVMPCHDLSHAAEADNVFEQAADISVVHDFRGGRTFVAPCGDGIGDDLQDEFLEPGVLNRIGVSEEVRPHFFNVARRVGEIVGDDRFLRAWRREPE